MNTGYGKLTEAGRKLGVHPDTIRYWVKLLEIFPVKQSNVAYIPDDSLEKLKAMKNFIDQGIQAKEAAERVKGSPATETAIVKADRTGPLEELKNALLLVVEEMKGMREENKIMRLENRALQFQVSSLQKTLEYKKEEEIATPTEPEKPLPIVISNQPAPIRAEIPRKIVDPVQKPQVQRELSIWESFTVFFDDMAGFVVGKG